MRGKKRVYICDSKNKRIVDIYIVKNNRAGGDVYMKHRHLYMPLLINVHQLSWSENHKYLREKGFK